jgi:hypothetical protein
MNAYWGSRSLALFIRIACWIPKATNTHSEYVILIALAQLQWLHRRTSVLRLYVHYLYFRFCLALLIHCKSCQNLSGRQCLFCELYHRHSFLVCLEKSDACKEFWLPRSTVLGTIAIRRSVRSCFNKGTQIYGKPY